MARAAFGRRIRRGPAGGGGFRRRQHVPDQDANAATLRQLASLAPGSTLVMTFLLPPDLLGEQERSGLAAAQKGAHASGTPFVSFFSPPEMLALARDAGFKHARHVPAALLNQRYFAGRQDGLRTSRGEELLVATT